MGQLAHGQWLRHHEQLRRSVLMQRFESVGLHTEQIDRTRLTALDEQSSAITQLQAPGLMNAAPSNRFHRLQRHSRQRAIRSHQVLPQPRVHRQS